MDPVALPPPSGYATVFPLKLANNLLKMPIEVGSKRGKVKLVDRNFLYHLDKLSPDGLLKYWRCQRRGICKARCHTEIASGAVVLRSGEHTHAANRAEVEVEIALDTTKDRALNTLDSTKQVIQFGSQVLSQAAKGSMPSDKNLAQAVQRARNREEHAPPNPNSLHTLVIPDVYKEYKYDNTAARFERFLFYDSGQAAGQDRILIFSTNNNLNVLETSNKWFADGTFSISPPLFTQLYTIHAERMNRVHPLIYALLPDKREQTCDRLVREVKVLAPNSNPQSIMTDFEKASMNAFGRQFPNAQLSGCYFHLGQNIWRNIQTHHLQQRYSNDANFALEARMIPALAFVPPADLDRYFDDLSNNVDPALGPILDYFEDTYLGRVARGGNQRRPPQYAPAVWNVYGKTLNGHARTNNSVEAFHRGTNSSFAMLHPTLWKFIEKLKVVQQHQDKIIEGLVAGGPPPAQRRKYVDLNLRLLTVVRDFQNRQPIDYLRGIAHNLSF